MITKIELDKKNEAFVALEGLFYHRVSNILFLNALTIYYFSLHSKRLSIYIRIYSDNFAFERIQNTLETYNCAFFFQRVQH